MIINKYGIFLNDCLIKEVYAPSQKAASSKCKFFYPRTNFAMEVILLEQDYVLTYMDQKKYMKYDELSELGQAIIEESNDLGLASLNAQLKRVGYAATFIESELHFYNI